MGAADRPAALDVDLAGRGVVADDLAAGDACPVHDEPGQRRLDVVDLDHGAVAEPEHALVGELAAALGVERGAVEDELDVVALAGRGHADAVDEHAEHARLADHLVVPGEVVGPPASRTSR